MSNNAATDSKTPYRELAGELVADAIALFAAVCHRHPEASETLGHLHIAFDGKTSAVLVLVHQPDGSAVLIEKINVDLKSPQLFGSSELHPEPIAGTFH